MSTRYHIDCPRNVVIKKYIFLSTKCAIFEKKCPRNDIVHEMSPHRCILSTWKRASPIAFFLLLDCVGRCFIKFFFIARLLPLFLNFLIFFSVPHLLISLIYRLPGGSAGPGLARSLKTHDEEWDRLLVRSIVYRYLTQRKFSRVVSSHFFSIASWSLYRD